jgi:glutamate synthase domain-containing protein 3
MRWIPYLNTERREDGMSRVLDAKGRDLKTTSTQLKSLLVKNPIAVKHAAHLHGLCGGLKSGEITIEGDSGDYLAVLNDGALIRVTGDAGKYVADNMTSGQVIVDGDADYGAAQYCYGGTVAVKGNAGDFTATMNKGATIIIGGDVGDEACTYMVAGDVVIVGNGGENLGNYLIRGSIYVGGDWASLGHNCALRELNGDDTKKLEALLEEYGLSADVKSFRKITPQSDKPFYSH